ncbi:Ig-like domain-containing protein [Cohnella sp. GCM10027633]|uniref:Ig-like domain-containing protein n=1 Tax=unclassified Cohnella TaxID=2636738 RepID=UPI00362F9D25
MSSNQEPMIKLQPGGTAPILSYNVPEPTAYSGRNFIDLSFPDSYFTASTPANAASFSALAAGDDSSSRLSAQQPSESLDALASISPEERLSPGLAKLTEDDVLRMEASGKKLNLYRSMSGALTYTFVDKQIASEPAFDAGAEASFASLARLPSTETDGSLPTLRPIDDGGGGDPLPEPINVSVDITSPASNATVTGPYTGAVFSVHGYASNSGDGSISSVQVKIGSGAYQNAQLNADGSWVFPNATANVSGTIPISAKAFHSFGTKTAVRTINVTVSLAAAPDTTLPTVNVTSPAPGQFFSTNGAPSVNVTFEGTASDDRGVSKVEMSINNGAFSLVDTTNGYANWKKTIGFSSGTQAVTFKATDAAGNFATKSLSFTIDTSPPSLSITTPLQNAQIAGTNSKGATIEITGTASDAGGVKHVEVSLNLNPSFIRATEKGQGDWSTWRATLNVTEPGIHIITARCTDNANNTIEKSVSVNVTIVPEVSSRLKRIILVESYRMSSFLGNYGAGRTIKTFSLLPGEKSKISIRSYTQNETTAKNASTILDSVTDEIADEFEKSMGNEQTDQKNYKESFEYRVSAEASASWGWGSASVSASASGGTNSAREQFARNISNSTQKHVARASARRDLQVNTSYEEKTTSGEESAIVREIENINVGRSLNFVFRQMNQEFITLLHLVDLRIGFFKVELVNGVEKHAYKEVTLPQLDSLLQEIIVADKRNEVRNSIINQLMNIFDYQDRHHRFVEDKPFKDANGNDIPLSNYLRVKKEYVSTYNDEASGTKISVPGIILAANRHVLRTEGVMVEALLGQGEALDDYSRNLQTETVRERNLRNSLLEQEIKLKQLALEIVENRDEAAAKLYSTINLPPVVEVEGDAAASGAAINGVLAAAK